MRYGSQEQVRKKPLPEAEKLRYKRCGTEHERRACREVIETGNACPESRAGGWGSSAGERGSVRTDSRAVREQPGERAGVPGLRLDGSPEFRSGGRGAGDYALARQGKTRQDKDAFDSRVHSDAFKRAHGRSGGGDLLRGHPQIGTYEVAVEREPGPSADG